MGGGYSSTKTLKVADTSAPEWARDLERRVQEIAANQVHLVDSRLSSHPNYVLPPPPTDQTPEAIVGWAIEAVARYISPAQIEGEDDEFACVDLSAALREFLGPRLIRELTGDGKHVKRKRTGDR